MGRRLEAFHGSQNPDAAQRNLNRAFEGVGFDVVLELMELTRGLLGTDLNERNYPAFFEDIKSRTQKDPSLVHRRGLALVHAYETNKEQWDQQIELRAATVKAMNEQAAANQG